jgi:hypothetical protein
MLEIEDAEPTLGSAKGRSKSNAQGLALTESGLASVNSNEVNAKYESSYSNSENPNTLLGKCMTLGQACGIIGVALHCANIPLEDSGKNLHILHMLHMLHILIFMISLVCLFYSGHIESSSIDWSSRLLLGILFPTRSWRIFYLVNLNQC